MERTGNARILGGCGRGRWATRNRTRQSDHGRVERSGALLDEALSTRCRLRSAGCGTDLIGTQRMFGRETVGAPLQHRLRRRARRSPRHRCRRSCRSCGRAPRARRASLGTPCAAPSPRRPRQPRAQRSYSLPSRFQAQKLHSWDFPFRKDRLRNSILTPRCLIGTGKSLTFFRRPPWFALQFQSAPSSPE